MKFIHAANIRFGFKREEKGGEDTARELMTDFEKLLDACNTGNADVLFLTGNLFSGDASEEQLNALDGLFTRLEKTRVFLFAGSDDTYVTRDLLKNFEFKSRVICFTGESIRRIYLPRLNAEITGIGYRPEVYRKLTRDQILPGSKALIQILLLPFAGTDPANEDPDMLPEGYQYIGLGSRTLQMGGTEKNIYAPGLFEPDGFSDQVRHGFYEGEFTLKGGEPYLRCRFRAAASREYMVFQINAEPDVSYEEVEEKVKAAISAYGKNNYYKIILKGEASQSLFLNRDRLYDAGNIVSVEDRCDRGALLDRMRSETAEGGLGEFIESLAPDTDEETRDKALQYGINALEHAIREQETGE